MYLSLCYIVRHKGPCFTGHTVKSLVFTPCVCTQNTQIFRESSIMDENHIGPNIKTIFVHTSVRDGLCPSG